jgi:hypothetical protein
LGREFCKTAHWGGLFWGAEHPGKHDDFIGDIGGHFGSRHWQRLGGGMAELWRLEPLHPAHVEFGRWGLDGHVVPAFIARGF